jgi:hypothetical protein
MWLRSQEGIGEDGEAGREEEQQEQGEEGLVSVNIAATGV